MRPRIHLTSAERADVPLWTRRTLGAFAIVVVALWAISLVLQAFDRDAQAFARPSTSPCMDWDDAASNAIIPLVQSKSDRDLRQVSDAVIQMRRAAQLRERLGSAGL